MSDEKDELGLPDPYREAREKLMEKKRHSLYLALEEAACFFQENFPRSPAEAYARKRGFNDDTIKKWRLGYSHNAWQDLNIHWHRKGFDPKILEEAGLIRTREKNWLGEEDCYYDFFRNRLMFPMWDHQGKLVGFGARAIDSESKVKYLNSPKTLVFNKGGILYGLNFVLPPVHELDELDELDEIVVVEGYTDVIHAHQAGLENIVGTIGIALTSKHLELLRGVPKLTLCFDGDDAGIKAAIKASELVIARPKTSVCVLPEGKDPGDIFEAGEDFRKYLGKKEPVFNFLFHEFEKKHDLTTINGRANFAKDMAELIVKVRHVPSAYNAYIHIVASKIGVGYNIVEETCKQIETENKRYNRPRERQPTQPASRSERVLLERPVLESEDDLWPLGEATSSGIESELSPIAEAKPRPLPNSRELAEVKVAGYFLRKPRLFRWFLKKGFNEDYFAVPAARAAVHYLTVCEDKQPLLETFPKGSGKEKKNGQTTEPAPGQDPGYDRLGNAIPSKKEQKNLDDLVGDIIGEAQRAGIKVRNSGPLIDLFKEDPEISSMTELQQYCLKIALRGLEQAGTKAIEGSRAFSDVFNEIARIKKALID